MTLCTTTVCTSVREGIVPIEVVHVPPCPVWPKRYFATGSNVFWQNLAKCLRIGGPHLNLWRAKNVGVWQSDRQRSSWKLNWWLCFSFVRPINTFNALPRRWFNLQSNVWRGKAILIWMPGTDLLATNLNTCIFGRGQALWLANLQPWVDRGFKLYLLPPTSTYLLSKLGNAVVPSSFWGQKVAL